MVTKVNARVEPSMSLVDIKSKLVNKFEQLFNEEVENDNIDLSNFSDGDDVVPEVTEQWGGQEKLVGFYEAVAILGFSIKSEVKLEVTFEIV
jgi:hypothetical protein